MIYQTNSSRNKKHRSQCSQEPFVQVALVHHFRSSLAGRLGPWVYCHFRLVVMMLRDEFDPLAPHREAAFFYGLFLRGHSLRALREDIDVPRPVVDKWLRAKDFEDAFKADLDKVYQY